VAGLFPARAAPSRTSPTHPRLRLFQGGLACPGLSWGAVGWAGLGWAGVGWAREGWAGLGCGGVGGVGWHGVGWSGFGVGWGGVGWGGVGWGRVGRVGWDGVRWAGVGQGGLGWGGVFCWALGTLLQHSAPRMLCPTPGLLGCGSAFQGQAHGHLEQHEAFLKLFSESFYRSWKGLLSPCALLHPGRHLARFCGLVGVWPGAFCDCWVRGLVGFVAVPTGEADGNAGQHGAALHPLHQAQRPPLAPRASRAHPSSTSCAAGSAQTHMHPEQHAHECPQCT